MVNYKNWKDGFYPNIKHANNDYETEVLVIGWLEYHRNVEGMERRYALHSDGRMMRTKFAMPNCQWFGKKGMEWEKVDHIPDNAAYMGHYPADMFHD